jgi:GNAT superfamily N-acetyltransferase
MHPPNAHDLTQCDALINAMESSEWTIHPQLSAIGQGGCGIEAMDDAELRTRGDENLAEYLLHLARSSTGGAALRVDGAVLFAGGHRYPGTYTNGVLRTADSLAPGELLELADDFFRPMRRGYMLWVRDHADADLEAFARDRGLWLRPPEQGNPGLAVDHPLPATGPLPDGVELRLVTDERARDDYVNVVLAGYGFTDVPPDLRDVLTCSRASLDDARVTAFVAYDRDRPVAVAQSFLAAGSAGVQWVASMPEARSRGLGSACYAAACNAGFAQGAECSTAQSSVMGTPRWLRLGCRVVTHYRRYFRPPGA